MCQWVLKRNGHVVPRRLIQPLKTAEVHSEVHKCQWQVFNELICWKLGNSINPPKEEGPSADDSEQLYELYKDNDEQPLQVPEIEDSVDSTGRLINQQPAYDTIINSEVLLQQGEETVQCMVK